jgi:hypothetical protein
MVNLGANIEWKLYREMQRPSIPRKPTHLRASNPFEEAENTENPFDDPQRSSQTSSERSSNGSIEQDTQRANQSNPFETEWEKLSLEITSGKQEPSAQDVEPPKLPPRPKTQLSAGPLAVAAVHMMAASTSNLSKPNRPPLPSRPQKSEALLHRGETTLGISQSTPSLSIPASSPVNMSTGSSGMGLSISPPLGSSHLLASVNSVSHAVKPVIPDTKMTFKVTPVATYLPTTEFKVTGSYAAVQQIGKQPNPIVDGLVSMHGFEILVAGKVVYIPSSEVVSTHDLVSLFLTPSSNARWILSSTGSDLTLTDMDSGESSKTFAHSSPVSFIIDSESGVITVDDGGGVRVWYYTESVTQFFQARPKALRVAAKPSLVVASILHPLLFTHNGKTLEIYTLADEAGSILKAKVDTCSGIGFGNANVICMQTAVVELNVVGSPSRVSKPKSELLFMGFDSGHISIYCSNERIAVVQLTQYKITALCWCANRLWVGLGTGKILVLEFEWIGEMSVTGCATVTVILEFQAHHNSSIQHLVTHRKNTTGDAN